MLNYPDFHNIVVSKQQKRQYTYTYTIYNFYTLKFLILGKEILY